MLGRERDADLEIALGAVGEVGRQLVLVWEEANGVQHRSGPVDDVGERKTITHHVPRAVARLRGDSNIFENAGPRQDIGDLVGTRQTFV